MLTALKLICGTFCVWAAMSVAALAQAPDPLNGGIFGSGNGALVVVLHGDVSNGGPADYHYAIAKDIARRNGNVTVLAMLRPGYQDSEGRKSRGSNNQRRDHYTRRNNTLVAQTIQNMAAQVGTQKIIAVGHSGGAAQIGTIAGLFPRLLDSAILVSCPCDIDRWRQMRGRSRWTKSQSPSDFVANIDRSTRIVAITGTADDNTALVLAEDYVAAARARGLSASFVPVRGAGHGFSGLASATANAVAQELRK